MIAAVMKLVDAAAINISVPYRISPRLSMKPPSTTAPVIRKCLEHVDGDLRAQIDKARVSEEPLHLWQSPPSNDTRTVVGGGYS